MEPKFGQAALYYMLAAIRGLLLTQLEETDKPVLALFKTTKASFPTGEGEDSWTEWEEHEATFKGYTRQVCTTDDFPDPTTAASNDHQEMVPEQKTFQYDSEEAGDDDNEIGWVALLDRGSEGTSGSPLVIAAYPIPAKTMAGDADVIRVVMPLTAWSLPYPPA